jgi:NAD-dependent dihydropyrimidine dehydrogenase PreA subunit
MGIERIDGCIGRGTCVATCPMDVLRLETRERRSEIRRADDGSTRLVKHPIRRG